MSGSDFTISTLDITTRNALLEQAAYELDALSGNLGVQLPPRQMEMVYAH